MVDRWLLCSAVSSRIRRPRRRPAPPPSVSPSVGRGSARPLTAGRNPLRRDCAGRVAAANSTAVLTDASGSVTRDEAGGLYTWGVRHRLSALTRSGVTSLFGYNQNDLGVSK